MRQPQFAFCAACLVLGSACGDTPQEVLLDPSDMTPLPVLNQPVALGVPVWLDVPTYDGSGQGVEPDVLYFPGGWRGWEYWMAFNPYPNGDEFYENPSILASHDGTQWVVPEGLVNPVVPFPRQGKAHNSDPDLFYAPDADQLVLVYREVNGGRNILKRLTSTDGVSWSPVVQVLEAPNHQLISPAIVARAGRKPLMWVVDAGVGCAAMATNVVLRRWLGVPDMSTVVSGKTWSKPVITNLQQPGYIVWHIDVIFIESMKEYWAVYAARPLSTKQCGKDNNLFFARSRDGVHWKTFDKPFLTTGVTPWATATLYRSTMLYDSTSNMFRVWLSASADGGPWYLGYVEVPAPLQASPSSAWIN